MPVTVAQRTCLQTLPGGIVLTLLALIMVSPVAVQAQGFEGGEPGVVGSQRVLPGSRIFDRDQEDVCVKINEVTRTSSRSCVYRCGSGQSFERSLPRTRFCDLSLTLTNRQLAREVSGEPPT